MMRTVFSRSFTSLQHRNYRLLWFGTLVSNSGDWMDQIALNWLVYQITDSAVSLGLLNLFRLAPLLFFTLLGGVVADRLERRRLLVVTQSVAMLLAFLLAVLVSTGMVQFWMVLSIAIGRGITLSFNQPARQSLISELVPAKELMNAIALNSATLNLTRILGPAIGGLIIATVGVAGAFYLNGASFLAVLVSLAMMQFPVRHRVRSKRGMLEDLTGGLKYLRAQPALRSLVFLALAPMVLGMPYLTLLTIFASDVLKVGGSGLGLLTACSGVGAVAGSLFVASAELKTPRGWLMMTGMFAFGLALLVFALSQSMLLSVASLVFAGASQQLYLTTNNTLLQTYVDEEYRGRVISTLFLNRSALPLGTMIAGFGAELFGIQGTVATMALLLTLLAIAAARFAPEARDLA